MTPSGLDRKQIFIVIFVLTVLGWFLLFDFKFISDGERYYAYLRSFFIDGDLNFYNEYTFYTFLPSPQKGKYLQTTETGYLWNPFAIGPALLWFPFFLIGHFWVLFANLCGYPVLTNGYSHPYLIMISLGTLFFGITGLYCCYLLSSRYFEKKLALLVTLLTFWSSPALAYLYRETAYSHIMNFCVMCLFLLLWVEFTADGKNLPQLWQTAILGCLGGMMFLVRWQEGLVLLLPAIHIVLKSFNVYDRGKFWHTIKIIICHGCIVAITVFITIAPQFFTWKVLYGSLFLVPQGQNFLLYSKPDVLRALFSPLTGLVTWHPFLIVGLIGFFLLLKNKSWLIWTGLVFLMTQLYVNSIIIDDRFATPGFGNRRFITCLPFLVLGSCALLQLLKGKTRILLLALLGFVFPVWNLLMMVVYYRGYISRFEGWHFDKIISSRQAWFDWLCELFSNNYLYRWLTNQCNWVNTWAPWIVFLMIVLVLTTFFVLICRLISQGNMFTASWSVIFAAFWCCGFVIISALIMRSDLSAKTVRTIHLGRDAMGKVCELRLARPELYMGSLTPIHLQPDQEITISLNPSVIVSQLLLIATLSGDSTFFQGSRPAFSIVLSETNQKRQTLLFSCPDDVDLMDREDYPLFNRNLPPISSSWFDPCEQTKPQHWYRIKRKIDPMTNIQSLSITNTSEVFELHVTGIAFQ